MANNEHNSNTIGSEDRKQQYKEKISELEKRLKEESKLTLAERKKIEKTIADYKWDLEQDVLENSDRNRRKAIDDEHNLRIKKAKEEGDIVKAKLEEAFGTAQATAATIQNAIGSLTKQVDSVIENYVNQQLSISAHLVGSSSLTAITSTLTSALSTSTLVKQEAVYNKLASLVQSGIVYNVEQRAFLQAIADDIKLNFGQDGQLNRLIRLQNQDLTANRMAIAYSLQEFLNQNYSTSEYIKEAFTSVSDALIDTQSMMSSSSGLALESSVQSWLGSLYSSGAQSSTISSLATAINALGSGNIDDLGSGISNLILMGVARAGLSYSDLINNGISSSDVNTIMSNVVSYMAEMNSSGSNVLKSQLSKAFGVGVTDLVAASKLGATSGGVTSDIYSALLSNYGSLVPFATSLENLKSNAIFTWGANVASNTGQYIAYNIEEMLSNSGLGQIISGIGTAKGGLSGAALTAMGYALSAAPIISLVSSGVFGDIVSSLSNASGGLNSAAGIFNALGAANNLGSTVKVSGSGVSGSAYIGNSGTQDMLSGSSSSLNTTLAEAGVSTGDEETSEHFLELINTDVYNIWTILENNISDMNREIGEISSTLSLMRTSTI